MKERVLKGPGFRSSTSTSDWPTSFWHNESSADRFIDLLTHHFRLLGDAPYAGPRRDELRPAYRSFPVGEYLILYRVAEPGVCIMNVVPGRRNLEALVGH